MENTVRRDSIEQPARPLLWASIDSAFPLPCFFSISASSFFPPGAF